MNTTTTSTPCSICGGPDDLHCPCILRLEEIATGTPAGDSDPGDPDAPAAQLVLTLIQPLQAGYYVIDRP